MLDITATDSQENFILCQIINENLILLIDHDISVNINIRITYLLQLKIKR